MRSLSFVFVLSLCFLLSCSKNKSATQQYSGKLNRSFTWQVTAFTTRGAQGDTTYVFPDTVLPISVITPDSLLFAGSTFGFVTGEYPYLPSRAGDDGERLLYADQDHLSIHERCTLEYYYHKDSVAIVYYSSGLGGYRTLTYASKH